MKISVELSETELREICQVTGETKKGPAIRKLVTDALMLKRRERLTQKFVSGEWALELASFDTAKAQNRKSDVSRAKAWRK